MMRDFLEASKENEVEKSGSEGDEVSKGIYC